jgi:hypothetical protein
MSNLVSNFKKSSADNLPEAGCKYKFLLLTTERVSGLGNTALGFWTEEKLYAEPCLIKKIRERNTFVTGCVGFLQM